MEYLDAVALWLQENKPSLAQEVTCYVVWLVAYVYILYCEHHPVQTLFARLLWWAAFIALTPLYLLYLFMLGYPVLKRGHEFQRQFIPV